MSLLALKKIEEPTTIDQGRYLLYSRHPNKHKTKLGPRC